MRVFLPLLFLAGLLSACFRVAGGTSETSNGDLHARVTYADGRPAASVPVLVVDDSGWMAKVAMGQSVVMDSIRTDASGWVRLKVPASGRCNLQVDGEGEGLFLKDVAGAIRQEKAAGHELDHLELAPFGSVEGMVRSDSVSGLRIMGSTYYARFDDGAYSFPVLPEGEYTLVPMVGGAVVEDTSGSMDVTVAPDSAGTGPDVGPEVTVPYGHGVFASWPRFRKIPVQVPAGTQDTLLEFPFLVRLDSSNFDFRQSNGKDIRFSNAKGHEVPHALISYDSVARRAEIWVRAVYTKGKDDSLVFLWGKKDAHATSNSHAVFPDYSMVLHADAKVNPAGGGYKYTDATASYNNGLGTAPAIKSGKIGEALSFGPLEDVYVPNDSTLMPQFTFTVSLWVRASPSGNEMELINMDDHWGLHILPDGTPEFFMRSDSTLQFNTPDSGEYTYCTPDGVDILDNEWHHLAAVYDGFAMRIYVDGETTVAVAQTGGVIYPAKDGELLIGYGPASCSCESFAGTMDEIRLAPHAWSPDRIRTEYQNQK